MFNKTVYKIGGGNSLLSYDFAMSITEAGDIYG